VHSIRKPLNCVHCINVRFTYCFIGDKKLCTIIKIQSFYSLSLTFRQLLLLSLEPPGVTVLVTDCICWDVDWFKCLGLLLRQIWQTTG